jgi:hypothetical protein
MSTSFSFPQFAEREIPTHTKLNALVDAITAKFTAGVGSADLTWPVVAEDDLSMSIYNITGGRQFWGIVNAGNYDTLDDAIAAAGSGGVVFVPPKTTIVASGAVLAGSGVAIIGAGPSSVIQLTAGATSVALLSTASASQTGVLISNLTLDGNTATGSGVVGLLLLQDVATFVSNVIFRNFSGAALKITNNGTDGTGCKRVIISNCVFYGGNAEHILVNDADELVIHGCASYDAGTTGVSILPASTSAAALVVISDMTIVSPGTNGINAQGPGATFSTSPVSLWLSNVLVDGTSAVTTDNFLLGDTNKVLYHLSASGCMGSHATRCGFTVCAGGGSITNCRVHGATTAGIDLVDSEGMVVTGNNLEGTTIGVDGGGTVNCLVANNIVSGTVPVVYCAGDNSMWDNQGAGHRGAIHTNTEVSYTVAADGDVCVLNIPAKSLRVGSIINVSVEGRGTGDDDATYQIWLKIGDQYASKAGIPESDWRGFHMEGRCIVTSTVSGINSGYTLLTSNGVFVYAGTLVTTIDCTTVVPVTVCVTARTGTYVNAIVYNMVVRYGSYDLGTYT